MRLEDIENDLKAVEQFANPFWASSVASSLTKDNREDVLQTARALLYKYPFDPKRKTHRGEPMGRDSYIRRILPTALQIWRSNEKLREEAYSQQQAAESEEGQEQEARINRVEDPLDARRRNDGGIVLFDEFSLNDIESPPYRVEFLGATSPHAYRSDPYFVPKFIIEPKNEDVLAVGIGGKQPGKKRYFGRKDLPSWTREVLEDRRIQMGWYIRSLIPHYLMAFGFSSLESRHRAVVADVNRHGLTPTQIQNKRRLKESTYYSYLNVLQRRGWDWEWHQKKNRDVLRYNPVLDRCKSFYSSEILDIERIDVQAVLSLAGPAIEAVLYRPDPCEEVIHRELRTIRRDLRRVSTAMIVEADYDRRLRSFVSDLIERPVHCSLGYKDIEDRFRLLPFKKRLGLFCEAVRKKQSIIDVIDFGTVFAEELYDPREIERMAGFPTLSSLAASFKAA